MILTGRTTPLPATLDDRDGFHAAGFRFGATSDHEPLLRDTILPRRWYATGFNVGFSVWPGAVFDEFGRKRVSIVYTPKPRTARMRLVTLREYLATCLAHGDLPDIDPEWATPAAIHATALVEVEHADFKVAYFQERHQNRSMLKYQAARNRWSDLAARFDVAGVAA